MSAEYDADNHQNTLFSDYNHKSCHTPSLLQRLLVILLWTLHIFDKPIGEEINAFNYLHLSSNSQKRVRHFKPLIRNPTMLFVSIL